MIHYEKYIINVQNLAYYTWYNEQSYMSQKTNDILQNTATIQHRVNQDKSTVQYKDKAPFDDL